MTLSWIQRAMLLVMASFVSACGVRSPEKTADLGAKFREVIPGRWREDSRDGNVHGYMEKTYFPNGTAEGVIFVSKRSLGLSFHLPEIHFKSRWRVRDGVTECYDIRSVPAAAFERHEVIRDRLVSVKPDRIDYIAESTGKRGALVRISPR